MWNFSGKAKEHFSRTHADVLETANSGGKLGTIRYGDMFESLIGIDRGTSRITAAERRTFSGRAAVASLSAAIELTIGKPPWSRSVATQRLPATASQPSWKCLYWSREKCPRRGLLRQSRSRRPPKQTPAPSIRRQGRSPSRDRRSLQVGCAERPRPKQFSSWRARSCRPPSDGAAANSTDSRRCRALTGGPRRGGELDDIDGDHVDVRLSDACTGRQSPPPTKGLRQSSMRPISRVASFWSTDGSQHETCLSRQQRHDTGRS